MSTRQPETVVHLKVGERLFETTVGTLCQGGQNYFSGLFQFEDDESKVIFIDRDGDMFAILLKFLRTGKLLIPGDWTSDEKEALYEEAKFYLIPLPPQQANLPAPARAPIPQKTTTLLLTLERDSLDKIEGYCSSDLRYELGLGSQKLCTVLDKLAEVGFHVVGCPDIKDGAKYESFILLERTGEELSDYLDNLS